MLEFVFIILFTSVTVVVYLSGPPHSAVASSGHLSVSVRLLSTLVRQHGDGSELPLVTPPGQKPWKKHQEKTHTLL